MKRKFKKLSLSTETLRSLGKPDLAQAAGVSAYETKCGANCTYATQNCTACNCPRTVPPC
jgi:hypothetical protein